MPGERWVDHIREVHQEAIREQASSVDDLTIPQQRDGSSYDVDLLSKEQKSIVYTAVDTVLKFLTNDPTYKPMRATIMGPGGTGKSHIVNTIIGMVRKMTNSNDTVQIAAPSGAAAYNVQGSTIHNLLGVRVHKPEKEMTEKTREKLLNQLERLLVLIIDERSMVSSNVLAAAERNTRNCIYRGQNSNELWGGLPVVLLFGDDYQLMPVTKNGAINGFAKRQDGAYHHVTEKMTGAQLLAYHGDWLFTEVMTDKVYFLTKNYRVKCKEFEQILDRVRKGNANYEDAKRLMKNHRTFYKHDKDFQAHVENNDKTMWLYSTNNDVREKNVEKLVQTSESRKVPVAKLQCHFETNKLQGEQTRCPVRTHFEDNSFLRSTNICVGARVALRMWNILPSAGLYNGAIGTVVEIVYKDRPVGPNDKEHYHLPDYVVVDFPNLKLPPHIQPWDRNNVTVSASLMPLTSFVSSQNLTKTNFIYTLLNYNTKHVPIPARTTLCQKTCCSVHWCPLEPSWATTIHKFQGFEAGFDEGDMFNHLIVDPGDLNWEQLCPGAFYVALSRAKTIGTLSSETAFPRDSAIYWIGSGVSITRIVEGSLKLGKKGQPKTKCVWVSRRDQWVQYLTNKKEKTKTHQYTSTYKRYMKSVNYTQGEVRDSIIDIITNPNDNWARTKRSAHFHAPKNFFGQRS